MWEGEKKGSLFGGGKTQRLAGLLFWPGEAG